LHALVDDQLTAERRAEVEAWLDRRPEETRRVAAYAEQRRALAAMLDATLTEPMPERLQQAAAGPAPAAPSWAAWQRAAAAVALTVLGGIVGWTLNDGAPGTSGRGPLAAATPDEGAPTANGSLLPATLELDGFANRAAVAHAVYSADQRRGVEIDATHEDQLVTWLSKRMGEPLNPPHLQTLGYSLEGGRLLPGGSGPVAQFMYRDAQGGRLSLYVTNRMTAADDRVAATASQAPAAALPEGTAFRFWQDGAVQTFYWVDGRMGYALSADTDRQRLAAVASAVYASLATSQAAEGAARATATEAARPLTPASPGR